MSGHEAPSLLLDDEQKMLSKTVHELVRERAPASRLRTFRDSDDSLGFSKSLWKDMADLGWLGLQIPEAHGGMGLGFFDLCVVLEQTGRELMPEPFVSTLLLSTQALLLGGSEAQKASWLPGVVSGDLVLSLGYEDVGAARSDRIDARQTSDGYELRGWVSHVLDAHVADRIIVEASTRGGDSTLFLVDPTRPEVSITRQRRLDGLNAGIVRLEGLRVKEDDVVGSLGGGVALMEAVLDRAAVGLAAQMLGGSEQAFADTLAYLKERQQFDVPIGSFQALQHRAVAIFTEIALTRSVVLAAARAIDQGSTDVPRLSSLAKAIASDTFLLASKEAIQMHGGIGVTDEHDIGLYLKRAQGTYMTFGKPSQHRRRWAELHGY
ncbi:MAG: acyl-CoA dehydrogenase family protein [Myxococcales bacterium]|jgi:acyl-CoA dehydrogenase